MNDYKLDENKFSIISWLVKYRDLNDIFTAQTVDKKIFDAGHHHGSTYYEHLGFINSINNKLPAEVSIKDGLYSVAMGQAAEISAKEGRVVRMSEFNL